MFALREALSAGLFHPRQIARNVLAGLVVGSVALPLAMAFAIASGAKPEQGIYTALIGAAIVSIFGGSRVQIAGPTGAFIVILSGITAKYGLAGLEVSTLLAGVFLVLLGLARLGSLIAFIPAPVITGFTTGIGALIWIGQWKDFFGLHVPSTTTFLAKLLVLCRALPHLHASTTLLGIASLLVVIATPNIPFAKRIPGPLLALLLATLANAIFHFSGVATIGSAFGGLPKGLPMFHLPDLRPVAIMPLLGPACAIALLGAIESLLSATVADSMAGTRHRPNQELIGQGLANIVSPFFGGFAVTGAIARTATNIKNGGTSPLAGIVHSLFLLMVLLFLTPFAREVPLCTLSAILFVVAFHMSEVGHFIDMMRRAPRADTVILLTTFLLTLCTDLVIAVNVGVVLAILQFMRRMTASVEIEQVSEQRIFAEHALRIPQNVLVYSIKGPFFFGAVQSFEQAVAAAQIEASFLIIRLHHVPFADITGLQALERAIQSFEQRHIKVMLCEANKRVQRKLERAGITHIGDSIHPCFTTLSEALLSCDVEMTPSDEGFAFDS